MDVVAWLRSLGLPQYEAAFRDNAVDGNVLPSLTAEDLKEIGVVAVGHRRTMLDAITGLKAAGSELVAAEPRRGLRPPAAVPEPLATAGAERRQLDRKSVV